MGTYNPYKQIGYFNEETPEEKVKSFNSVESKILFSRQEIMENLLYKNEKGECEILYEGKKRKGLILGGSSSGSMIIGILKEDQKN